MDSSSTDVMGEYTDCGALRAQGLRQGLRQPGGYKPSLSQNSTRNNIVDHQGACRVNKDNPMCSRGPVRTATPSDVQRVYGAIITGQLKSIRSQLFSRSSLGVLGCPGDCSSYPKGPLFDHSGSGGAANPLFESCPSRVSTSGLVGLGPTPSPLDWPLGQQVTISIGVPR